MAERWLPIPGLERYEVSDLGRVRRAGRSPRNPDNHNGYPRFQFRRQGGRRQHLFVHVAVLLAFVGPRPPGHDARHLDGNPSNCVLSNLAWGTKLENMRDRDRHGKTCAGSRHGRWKGGISNTWKRKLVSESIGFRPPPELEEP